MSANRPWAIGDRRSPCEGGKQVSQFVLHFPGTGHGIGDFGPEHFAISLPQAMDGNLHGAFARSQADGDFGITNGATGFREGGLELLENLFPSGHGIFLAQAAQYKVKEGERPTTFINLLGRNWIGGFKDAAGRGGGGVNGDGDLTAPTLLRPGLVPFIGQKMLEGGEQLRPEPSPGFVGSGQRIPGEQPREEFLGQVLGVVR